jgi:uncharacterized protein
MSETLPLFPLGTVLYPGLLLPLHIFEERYRLLMRDLLDGSRPRRFGVVAIREGRETGVGGARALFDVGCIAELRRVSERADGRFDVVSVGAQRFRLLGRDESRPYLQGEVEVLAEETGDRGAAHAASEAVRTAFRVYFDTLASKTASGAGFPDLPGDPVALSYLVASSMIIDLPDKQELLAKPDAVARLTAERALLARETTMLRSLTSAPAPDLRYAPYSSN